MICILILLLNPISGPNAYLPVCLFAFAYAHAMGRARRAHAPPHVRGPRGRGGPQRGPEGGGGASEGPAIGPGIGPGIGLGIGPGIGQIN